jgi:hypothetical protein
MPGIARAVALVSPERAAVGQVIELVEELGAIPGGLVLVGDDGLLPGVDGLAPFFVMLERGAGDLPGVRALGAEEARVMAIPFAAAAELDDGQVPAERHGDEALFMRREREAHGECAGKCVAARGNG